MSGIRAETGWHGEACRAKSELTHPGLGLHVQQFHTSARDEERDKGGKLQDDRKGKSSEVQDQTTNDKNYTDNELNLGLLVRIGCFTNCRLASELARLR